VQGVIFAWQGKLVWWIVYWTDTRRREREGEKKEINMEHWLKFSYMLTVDWARYCAVNCGGLTRCRAAVSGIPVLECRYRCRVFGWGRRDQKKGKDRHDPTALEYGAVNKWKIINKLPWDLAVDTGTVN